MMRAMVRSPLCGASGEEADLGEIPEHRVLVRVGEVEANVARFATPLQGLPVTGGRIGDIGDGGPGLLVVRDLDLERIGGALHREEVVDFGEAAQIAEIEPNVA